MSNSFCSKFKIFPQFYSIYSVARSCMSYSILTRITIITHVYFNVNLQIYINVWCMSEFHICRVTPSGI